MDIFQKLPMAKRSAMELLFQNCTEKVKNYMFTMDVAAGQTFIQAGEPCINIVIILSGRASGVEWPMHGHSYPFKDFGPGDFWGEIESFAGKFDETFGSHAEVAPFNIIDTKQLEVKTPDVVIKLSPEAAGLLETRVIDGQKFIVIRAEGTVEVNGVEISICEDKDK